MNRKKTEHLFKEAKALIPGGVDSPVRSFLSVDTTPVFAAKGEGAYLIDPDQNRYTDYIMSWGPLIFGHANRAVLEEPNRISDLLYNGTSYGLATEYETLLAEKIIRHFDSLDKVRFVNSGTEAVMSAIRLARGYTGKDKIIKFEGGYHGHSDAMLVKGGSGMATFGKPSSDGVPVKTAADTLCAEYNNLESVKALFDANPGEIAAVIVEPVAGNMGVIGPEDGFLEGLRELTRENGSLLIFDEVITGFRLSPSGMQGLKMVKPDITVLGKIIGGGLPVGAFGARDEIMSCLAPEGAVYQAGTLSGNPIAMLLGINQITRIENSPDLYKRIEELADYMARGIERLIAQTGVPASVSRYGGMLTLFFRPTTPKNYSEAAESNTVLYSHYFKKMLERDELMPPSQFEGIFLSAAHTKEDIDKTLMAMQEVFKELKEEGLYE